MLIVKTQADDDSLRTLMAGQYQQLEEGLKNIQAGLRAERTHVQEAVETRIGAMNKEVQTAKSEAGDASREAKAASKELQTMRAETKMLREELAEVKEGFKAEKTKFEAVLDDIKQTLDKLASQQDTLQRKVETPEDLSTKADERVFQVAGEGKMAKSQRHLSSGTISWFHQALVHVHFRVVELEHSTPLAALEPRMDELVRERVTESFNKFKDEASNIARKQDAKLDGMQTELQGSSNAAFKSRLANQKKEFVKCNRRMSESGNRVQELEAEADRVLAKQNTVFRQAEVLRDYSVHLQQAAGPCSCGESPASKSLQTLSTSLPNQGVCSKC
ncbi:hypothetical protein K491DRAFT_409053 [Lophiostoma macrostomum CBS 122681]|uniref:Uncharacterized protein n=1 Tax=Lophiostoma macrostomum CBS 122681 TaxID=1314788 RepID=A0A6A6T969_9PLEO|nr:hypothetical protein K491DRAFT_409053 [Lophiostoma macrostomum CBS 122681]